MKRLAWISTVLIAVSCILAPTAPVGAAASPRTNRDVLLLRAGDPVYGSLVAQPAVDQTGRALPLGLFDRAGHTLYAAYPQGNNRSIVEAVDVASGRVLRTRTIEGTFSTAAGSYAPGALIRPTSAGRTEHQAPDSARSGTTRPLHTALAAFPVDTSQTLSVLSFDGRWLALRDATPGARDTTAVVIATATLRVVATLHLKGVFGLDAISNDGAALYLIEKLSHAGPQAYQVRVYDVARRQLDPAPLTERGEESDIIRGVAYTRVWSPPGDWLYTLYVQPGHAGAFVHALGVAYRRVHCIMLPSKGTPQAQWAHYALAVAPDGHALYAVNTALGRAIVVRGGLPYGTSADVALPARAGMPQHTQTAAIVSPDGRTLFVATGHGVWALDAATLTLRGTYAAGQNVGSVALSRDGRRLYALEPDQAAVVALDPGNGHVLATIPVGDSYSGTAWSIETVVSSQ